METKFTFAKNLIKEAGLTLQKQMTLPFQVASKSSADDLVTSLDQAIQAFLEQKIQETYPEDAILAEENDRFHPIAKGNVWVIDPIDGTSNFVAQGRDFVIMLAYYEDGKGQFGLIYDVIEDKLYHGGGAFPVMVNDQLLPFYQDKDFSRSLIVVNSGMYAKDYCGIRRLVKDSLGVRVFGSAGISVIRVLEGQLWGYFSFLSPWDYAAAKVLGDKLGYVTVTFSGELPDFREREAIMMIPKQALAATKAMLGKKIES